MSNRDRVWACCLAPWKQSVRKQWVILCHAAETKWGRRTKKRKTFCYSPVSYKGSSETASEWQTREWGLMGLDVKWTQHSAVAQPFHSSNIFLGLSCTAGAAVLLADTELCTVTELSSLLSTVSMFWFWYVIEKRELSWVFGSLPQ